MLLSGGIEYTRTENRIASLDTLLEAEEKYMEILVDKIALLKPDILIVGRAVSRQAQELLTKKGIVLLQHVKLELMQRIARQTGAKILSNTDHVMNQFGESVLGECQRFRLLTFRDHEQDVTRKKKLRAEMGKWLADSDAESEEDIAENAVVDDIIYKGRGAPAAAVAAKKISNHERQSVLAASLLSDKAADGSVAIRVGLAKRGVSRTYVLLEGCPKELGCTVILRGGGLEALKQIKRVFQLSVGVAHNLRLETSYLRERCVVLPEYEFSQSSLFSSSLCVEYGRQPFGCKVKPWSGSNTTGGVQKQKESEFRRKYSKGVDRDRITAFDHQSILVSSVWLAHSAQCSPAEVKGICFYTPQDVSLGQFLRDSCFNMSLKCQNANCKKAVLDHVLSFIHKDGQVNIHVEQMESRLPPPPDGSGTQGEAPIAMWSHCHECKRQATPLVYISDDVWNFSFGKFLEVFFYNKQAHMDPTLTGGCSCNMQASTTLYFGCRQLAARFSYVPVRPYAVYVRRHLPIDNDFHRQESGRDLGEVKNLTNVLLNKFRSKVDEMTVEIRSLKQSAANKPEHLQAVLGELNREMQRVGSDLALAKTNVDGRIEEVLSMHRQYEQSRREGWVVTRDLLNADMVAKFPWQTRRYLFLLCTSWNERLSIGGSALSAMKKLGVMVSGGGGSDSAEIVEDVVERVNKMMEFSSSVDERGAPREIARAKLEHHQDSQSRLSVEGVDVRVEDSVEVTDGGGVTVTVPTEDTDIDVSSHKKPSVEGRGNGVKQALKSFFNRGSTALDPYVVDLNELGRGRPRLEPGVNGEVLPVFEDQPSTIIAYSLSSTAYDVQFRDFSDEFRGRGVSTRTTNSSGASRAEPEKSSDGGDKVASEFEETIDDGPSKISRTKSLEGVVFPSNARKGGGSEDERATQRVDDKKELERRLLQRGKSHVKHHFRDVDEKNQTLCKYVCTSYWSTQFQALRRIFLGEGGALGGEGGGGRVAAEEGDFSHLDDDSGFIKSLSTSFFWEANGGKSGAAFSKTADGRFVVKCISRTELQMFLDCAPAYFEYLSKAFFHGLPTCLCKIVGVYQIGYHNRVTNKRSMEQVAVMVNVFYGRKITKIFDLKGSTRNRYVVAGGGAAGAGGAEEATGGSTPRDGTEGKSFFGEEEGEKSDAETVLLDENFLEWTAGRPLPLTDRAKALFHMSILNDSLFLSIINIIDYSILVGIDEEKHELVVGILDYMRQYDILKQMERVGKSVSMIAGQDAPTIIQPIAYKNRFQASMERFFATTPTKWTTTSNGDD